MPILVIFCILSFITNVSHTQKKQLGIQIKPHSKHTKYNLTNAWRTLNLHSSKMSHTVELTVKRKISLVSNFFAKALSIKWKWMPPLIWNSCHPTKMWQILCVMTVSEGYMIEKVKQVFMQNPSHENEFDLHEMNLKGKHIFIGMVLHEDSFSHGSKRQHNNIKATKISRYGVKMTSVFSKLLCVPHSTDFYVQFPW